MDTPEIDPDPPGFAWNWHDAWRGIHAGMDAGNRVGGLSALCLAPWLFLFSDRAPPLASWAGLFCCVPISLFVMLFVCSLMGGLAGVVAGFFRGATGVAGPGLIAGLIAASAIDVGLYALFVAWFPATPPSTQMVLIGPALAILIAGFAAGFADPHAIRKSGSEGEVAEPFRPLKILGIGWSIPKPGEPKKKPALPPRGATGIQRPDEGMHEKADSEEE